MAKRDPSPRSEITAEVAFWKDEIDTYERTFDKFLRRGRKIMKKYRDIRSPREDTVTRFNLLWANTQTRLPALYARNPQVVVERRYRDKDPVGRMASEILERSIQYTLDQCNDAWQVNRQVVLDYELSGRGTCWVRYVPHFHKEELESDDKPSAPPAPDERSAPLGEMHNPAEEIAAEGVQTSTDAEDEVSEDTLSYEETKLDYVYWEDFGHSWARYDAEVRGKWRRVFMDREELTERFLKSEGCPSGLSENEIAQIPLDWAPKTLTDAKVPISRKKAIVYEIWDKRDHCVLWVVKNFHKALDTREDPLKLTNFWPCPRPLCANLLNDDLIPTPNYTFYQDQANEVDELSTRIVAITKALKVAGVRDTSAEGLDRLLSEGVENQLVPVEGWATLKEKGGLAGVYELLPMKDIAETLGFLREQRKELIDDIYQLTGISDIIRGLSDPNETATAQQMKGEFSMVRLQDSQADVQRFCREQVQIIGEIVSDYDIETLKAISGVKLLTAVEKQQMQLEMLAIQRQMQQPPLPAPVAPSAGAPPGPAPGAPPPQAPQPGPAAGGMHPAMPSMPQMPMPGQAPPSPEKLKMLELPTWEEVGALLQNPVMREFRLDIETDSTIRMDEEAEKKNRIELMTAVSGFLQEAVTAGMQAPEVIPMLGEMLLFTVRGFKTARPVEQVFEDAIEALKKAAQTPRPNPDMMKAQIEAQTKLQIAQGEAQFRTQQAQAEQQAQAAQTTQQLQLEAQRDQHKAQLDAQLAAHKAQLDSETDMRVTDMKNHFEAQRVQFETNAKMQIAELQSHTQLKTKEMELGHQRALEGAKMEHEQRMGKEKLEHETAAEGRKHGHEAALAANSPQAKEAESKKASDDKVTQTIAELAEHIKRPRKVVRDQSGRIATLE